MEDLLFTVGKHSFHSHRKNGLFCVDARGPEGKKLAQDMDLEVRYCFTHQEAIETLGFCWAIEM